MAMHATFRSSGSLRQAPDAWFAVCTNRVENDHAFGPQSHSVGPCSEGWLKSCMKSAPQSTRSTVICPSLCGCPLSSNKSASFKKYPEVNTLDVKSETLPRAQ